MVDAKYVKDEQGNIFSPVNTAKSTFWDTPFDNEVFSLYEKMNGITINKDYDLNNITETGIYCFDHNYTYENIPVGVNGFMIVMCCSYINYKICKQIWYRIGTFNSNDYQTYVRRRRKF